jgi:hypothetical protein
VKDEVVFSKLSSAYCTHFSKILETSVITDKFLSQYFEDKYKAMTTQKLLSTPLDFMLIGKVIKLKNSLSPGTHSLVDSSLCSSWVITCPRKATMPWPFLITCEHINARPGDTMRR